MITRKELIKKNDLKPTKTTVFFLPIFEYNMVRYKPYLINFYISDFKEDPKITMVFENSEDICFIDFITVLMENPYFNQSWDDHNEISLEFSLPREYEYDFDMFLLGKYSEFSDKFKNLLLKTYGREKSDNNKVTMYEVLYPSDLKRKLIAEDLNVNLKVVPNEVFSVPNIDDERYLTIKEFKKKYNNKEIAV